MAIVVLGVRQEQVVGTASPSRGPWPWCRGIPWGGAPTQPKQLLRAGGWGQPGLGLHPPRPPALADDLLHQHTFQSEIQAMKKPHLVYIVTELVPRGSPRDLLWGEPATGRTRGSLPGDPTDPCLLRAWETCTKEEKTHVAPLPGTGHQGALTSLSAGPCLRKDLKYLVVNAPSAHCRNWRKHREVQTRRERL